MQHEEREMDLVHQKCEQSVMDNRAFIETREKALGLFVKPPPAVPAKAKAVAKKVGKWPVRTWVAKDSVNIPGAVAFIETN